MGKREHALSLSAYTSADRERASSLFVCPAIRLCLLASLSCYIPLLWPCRTFFNAHIFIFDTSPALLRNTAGDFSICQSKVFVCNPSRLWTCAIFLLYQTYPASPTRNNQRKPVLAHVCPLVRPTQGGQTDARCPWLAHRNFSLAETTSYACPLPTSVLFCLPGRRLFDPPEAGILL